MIRSFALIAAVLALVAARKCDIPIPVPSPSPTAPQPTVPTPPPTPTPPPPPAGCLIDFAQVDLAAGGLATAELDAAVKDAEIRAHPEGCEAGRCIINHPRPVWHAEVCGEVMASGLCCGFTDADEITVGTSNQPGTRVTNFHVFVGPGDGPGTVLWPPQARRDAWTLIPRGTPPPDPTPGPTEPPTSPDAQLCASDGKPVPLTSGCGGLGDIGWNAHYGRFRDFTPKINGCTDEAHNYCWQVGSFVPGNPDRGNKWCPARLEGGPEGVRPACERVALGGGMTFRCDHGEVVTNPANPFQATCSQGGPIWACNSDQSSCWGPFES